MKLPWDFVVPGVPISIQSKNKLRKRQWKDRVGAEARAAWPVGEPPLATSLQIDITYFHDDAAILDVDNQMKLIQDALSGIVYLDDKQLRSRRGNLRNLNGEYRLRGRLTPALGRGFEFDTPFVHVRITEQGDIEELP